MDDGKGPEDAATAVLDSLLNDVLYDVCFPLHRLLMNGAMCLECGTEFPCPRPVDDPPLGDAAFEERLRKATGERVSQMAAGLVNRDPGHDVFGSKPRTMTVDNFRCSHCAKKVNGNRFAQHLEKCMLGGGRQSSRLADNGPIRDTPSPAPKRQRLADGGTRPQSPSLVPSSMIDLSLFDAGIQLD